MGKVLIVDDDKEFRKRYKKLLRENGIGTFDAPAALEVANLLMREKSNIDLIILDLQIAEVDGRDIFDIVTDYAPNIPIIISSVLPLSEQKIKVPRARDYFNKAAGDKALLRKVKVVLGLN